MEAQVAFMKQNMHVFDEAEENKLEYMSIFESFVMSMEDLIDTKLHEQFPSDEVDSFYANLHHNFSEYEKIDTSLVATLLMMTDFVKFKESMLENKRAFGAGV